MEAFCRRWFAAGAGKLGWMGFGCCRMGGRFAAGRLVSRRDGEGMGGCGCEESHAKARRREGRPRRGWGVWLVHVYTRGELVGECNEYFWPRAGLNEGAFKTKRACRRFAAFDCSESISVGLRPRLSYFSAARLVCGCGRWGCGLSIGCAAAAGPSSGCKPTERVCRSRKAAQRRHQ
jgi:hypothetical protein